MSTYQPRHRKSVGRTFTLHKSFDNLYDRQWERYRIKFLQHNPECYSCHNRATVVDHLIPHKGDVVLFKKLDNHIPLCKTCHDTVTAKFDKNFKPGYPVGPKVAWLQKARARKEKMTSVKVLPSYEAL